MKLKMNLIGTSLGRFLLKIRDKYDLLKRVWVLKPSSVTILNDQLATFLVTRLCKNESVFLDIGAHIGSIIDAVIQSNKTVKVVAIEAIPDKAFFLRKKFPNITVHPCAVGIKSGKAKFYINPYQSGYSTLISSKKSISCTEINVDVKRLDDLLVDILDKVDVIKIDVEGAEYFVLQGGENLLTQSRPLIMFESGPPSNENEDSDLLGLYNFLDEKKYVIIVPSRLAHDAPGLSQEGFLESHFCPRRTTNYFAVPFERQQEFRQKARKILNLGGKI